MDDAVIEERMEQMLVFIQEYLSKHDGRSPSYREIAEGCFLSLGMVVRYLDKLEESGRVSRVSGQSRSVRVIDPISKK